MKLALTVLNELVQGGLLERYAIGGAMALLFHAEPVITYDLDIFCVLPSSGRLVDLGPIYATLEARGFRAEAENIVIGGVPVQFIPAYNPLVTEALDRAVARDFEGVPTRVVAFEYLLAIMLQTNRPKDRERLAALAGQIPMEEAFWRSILRQHGLEAAWRNLNLQR